jgi:bifunctional UDP-N-acetylglucosamine pyrophosphorylase / glucosamine-1-phosphate N-acetyltransferase
VSLAARPVQALLLAAGRGSRLKRPGAKVLLPAQGAPLLEHALRAVSGADPITVVVGHEAAAVEERFRGRAQFVGQDPPLGTGHAVLVARGAIARHPERVVLVLNGDLPLLQPATLEALLEAHMASGAAATLLTAESPDAGSYGRIVRGAGGDVRAVVEARDASPQQRALREWNVGVYAFAVPPLLESLERLTPQNAQGEYYLTDVVGHLVDAGWRVLGFQIEDTREGFGVNTLQELAQVNRLLVERRLHEMMGAGVIVEDPASTFVGLDVQVDAGAVLRAGTLLEGRTRVGAGATIGPFARLADVEIGPGTSVLDHCLLRECVVGAGASIGPFAHVRPETRIGDRARVGNFVELKKTRLGEGAKAPHLSYLGDATIGDAANIGAGTITCNYDGVAKHPTTIGDGAFVGSNSTLVAPVTIGAGSYVAAASVITEDVPADALAVARSRQTTKPDWARRRRESRKREPR